MVIRIMLVENFPRSLRSLSIYCTITELNVVVFFILNKGKSYFFKSFNFVFFVIISISGGLQ